jgi:VWFA-related protein
MRANRGAVAIAFLAFLSGTTPAQQAATPPQTSSDPAATAASGPAEAEPSVTAAQSGRNAPEISTEDTATTFKVKVNLVEVRVVVRDAQGNAVGNLKQEDFQLLDNGKPQVISRFSVERAGTKPPVVHQEAPSPAENTPSLTLPTHYIAYVFDDIHLQLTDLPQVKKAAERHLQSLQPTDRAAIFTTSGQNQVDFTDDRAKLREALNRIKPNSIANTGTTQCPDITYYMADQIQNKHDSEALRVAAQDADDCAFRSDPQMMRQAIQMAQEAAIRELNLGNHETQISLGSLKDVVRRIAAMPGQRSILIVSPGFYNPEQLPDQAELAERALHSYVTISALDARGLYTMMLEASNDRAATPTILPQMLALRRAEMTANAEVLSDLAYATGGTFFSGSNDLDKGFQQLATPPEYSYLLAFSPQNLKFDGRFHNLKVKVTGTQKLTVQARKGYYAPKQAVGAAEQAKQQIQDEVFSQEELHDLPVEMHTQFFKTGDDDAKLSVLVKLDVRHLHYRKAEGRNNNSLTVVSAVFDRNGNFVTGTQKVLQMHWKDETLNGSLASGITLKSSFEVKPGSYLVRLVVRDEDGQLAAQNGAIEIP